MAIHCGYDTDDLTDRQNHYFHRLNKDSRGETINMFAYDFLKHCVLKNFASGRFDNYDGDCDYLLSHKDTLVKMGIDPNEIYK